jgi:hypothetical protein
MKYTPHIETTKLSSTIKTEDGHPVLNAKIAIKSTDPVIPNYTLNVQVSDD